MASNVAHVRIDPRKLRTLNIRVSLPKSFGPRILLTRLFLWLAALVCPFKMEVETN